MNYEFSKLEKKEKLWIITLNRPERMNALHSPAHFELEKIFDDFSNDDDAWVAIITGEGDRAFCAGNDLRYQAEGGKMERNNSGFAGLTSRFNLKKPLIAAVNGVAFSSGLSVPELNRDSGDIIYVENRRPISRASDQTEDIKVVVEF